MAQFRTDTNKLDGANLITRFEVNMLSNRLTPSGTATDAFGRLRTSTPLTLFDSQHRYVDNNLWATSNTAGTTYAFANNQSLINMNVGTDSGQQVIRETKKVFAYQPGKSLLLMNTFVFNEAKPNLRQRIGYFNDSNGIFLEQSNSDIYFVKRSRVSGVVVDTKVPKSDWNIDKFDGTGASSQTSAGHTSGIDFTKTNILWTDIEWLGVGDVRMGFVIDGLMLTGHVFHNDNVNTLPYMSTASLPLRYEISNFGTTSSGSTLKQICSSVMSEGGYELRGVQQSVSTVLTAPYTMATAGTYYPIASIRLKAGRPDAIVIPTAVNILGKGNNTTIAWRIIRGCSPTAGTWVSGGASSAIEYNITATGLTGGLVLASGFLGVSTQASQAIEILKEALFRFQLERDPFTGATTDFTVACSGAANNDQAFASIDWEEITR
jgi:hypothetical protein